MSITPIPLTMKMEVLDRDGWDCLCCGRPTRRHPDGKVYADTLSFDHVHPEKHGGLTTADNLQVLCMACNLHKGVDTIDLRKIVTQHREGLAKEVKLSSWARNFPDADREAIYRGELERQQEGLPVWKAIVFNPWHMNNRLSVDEWFGIYQKKTPEQQFVVDRRSSRIWRWVPFKNEVRSMPPCPVRERELAVRAKVESDAERQLRVNAQRWLGSRSQLAV